ASTSARNTPGPTLIDREPMSTADIVRHRLRSTITPAPIAPPGMLLPEPRAMRAISRSRAHRTNRDRSSASSGTATAAGTLRPSAAASAYTPRGSSSVRKPPRNPPGAFVMGLPVRSTGVKLDPARRNRRGRGDDRAEQRVGSTPSGFGTLQTVEQL